MTLKIALAPQTNGSYRLAYPVLHEDAWICPFYDETPNTATSPEHKKITVKDEAGTLAERHFRIITRATDTAAWIDPISAGNDWPTNPKDPKEGIAALSCGHAFKAKNIHQWFLNNQQSNQPRSCPTCRTQPFENTLTNEVAGGAPIPLGKVHLIDPKKTDALAALSMAAGAFFCWIGVAALHSPIVSKGLLPPTTIFCLGMTSIFMGIGVVLENLPKINTTHTLREKVTSIASSILKGGAFNAAGAFILTATKYTLLTSSLIGAGAFVSTVAIALLYAQFLC